MALIFTTDSNRACEVSIHPSSVSFLYHKSSGKQVLVDVPYSYLLAVDDKSLYNKDDGCSQHSVVVHYVIAVVNRRFRLKSLTLSSDLATCQTMVDALRDELRATDRPKRLVVIINPNSGKKQAEKVFNKKIKPIFRLCNIENTVYVTKAPKKAYDLLDKLDLKGVDGIITVGGDGIYCEVMNALIVRTQKDHGVNVHDPDARIVPSTVPVGIIPAGTGDCVAQYLHGTRDIITAALHIVLGNTTPSNAVSVHQGGKLSAYAGLVLGFGLQGDMMYDCEKFRWMGQSRYNVVPITNVLSRRTFEVDVEYVDNDSGETKKISDTMYSVDTYVISKAERGEKVVPKFGDLVLSVYATSKCNLGKHVQQLSKLQDGMAGCFDYDFVKEIRTQGYKVRFPRAAVISNNGEVTLKDKYYINCDGDVLQVVKPEFEVRLHSHVMQLFGEAV